MTGLLLSPQFSGDVATSILKPFGNVFSCEQARQHRMSTLADILTPRINRLLIE